MVVFGFGVSLGIFGVVYRIFNRYRVLCWFFEVIFGGVGGIG